MKKINFNTNYFDVIVCATVIEHLSDIKNLFKKVHILLKNDEIFIIVTLDLKYNIIDFSDNLTFNHLFAKKSLNFALSRSTNQVGCRTFILIFFC